MIDFQKEELITLQQAAEISPGKPTTDTVKRWVRRGVRGIKLEALLVDGKWYTARVALDSFFQQLAAKQKPADAAKRFDLHKWAAKAEPGDTLRVNGEVRTFIRKEGYFLIFEGYQVDIEEAAMWGSCSPVVPESS